MARADRIFKRLLRLFPAEFRGDFGDEMAETFRDQRRETLAQGSIMAHIALWWDTLRGILTDAPREHFDLLRQDMRYGLRNLRRSPGFTAVAVTALAVGIGANTAAFSILNGVLLEALPYHEPQRLVTMFEKVPDAPVEKFGFSAPDFEIIRRLSTSFTGMAAYRNASYELSGIGQSERLIATRVSPELFSVLGVGPAVGHAFGQEDDAADAKVVVISYGLWVRAFGRDPGIVGRTVALDREPFTVVGVMPERFEFPPRGSTLNGDPASLYVPIAFSPQERQGFGDQYNNSVVARLKPGVTLEQARAELGRLTRPLAEAYPPQGRGFADQLSFPFGSFDEEVVGRSRRLLLVLMGAVGIVLLIGCADVANLMLTRSGARQRELAIRSALGASPARVVRQLLTEGFVLASLGGAFGLLLAYWTMQAFLSLAGETLPRVESIGFDARVVAFTAILALLTPLVFGVVPALRQALGSTFEALKEGGRIATPGHARHRLLGSLVVAQFALALMLSVGAGLLVRSFVRLLNTRPGFRSEHVVTASTTLPAGRYVAGSQVKQFYEQAIEAARAIPGVTLVGASNFKPLAVLERRTFTPDPSALPAPLLSHVVADAWTVGRYFEALGIPLKRGRLFTDADGRTPARVVLLNEILARSLWPDQDPIGRQIKWGGPEAPTPWMTVVGVVGDVKQGPLHTMTIAQVYEPLFQISDRVAADTIVGEFRTVNLVVRSERDPRRSSPHYAPPSSGWIHRCRSRARSRSPTWWLNR